MGRLIEIGLSVQSWESNHRRQINQCLDAGCPPGEVEDIRKALSSSIKATDPDLTKAELDLLTRIEITGITHD